MSATNAKEALQLIVSVANAAGKSLEDGKVGLTDLLNFVRAVQDIGPAIQGIDQVPAELANLSDDDKAELFQVVASLDLPSDQVEAYVEKGLKAALLLAELILPLIKKAQAA